MTLSTYLSTPISKRHTDLLLLFSYTITGLLDSSSVLVWGSFASMQTGNTIYLGSGLVAAGQGEGDDKWLRALLSILSFLAGSFCFSRYHRVFSSSRRWVLVSATAIQLVFMTAAAVMVTVGPRHVGREQALSVWVAVPIVLVAFQAAGQAVVSRVVKFPSLTGVVLTSIYLDLAGDAKLFEGFVSNAERNRRIGAVLLLLIGAVLGGLWAQSDVGMMGALWTAVGLKGSVLLAWVFWPGEKEAQAGDIA